MQLLRGTKDILPDEIQFWQHIYDLANDIFLLSNYNEIRTPILEQTNLFKRSIGNDTDIVNKEMYNFLDQSKRCITLRPEGTASIARAFISNKLYTSNNIHRLWYMGPMFRYERPQKGRQRQFHQLGIECIGSLSYIADVEVIRLAIKILETCQLSRYKLEINSIGSSEERQIYKYELIDYLIKYKKDLDEDSKKRLEINPLRILDSKNIKTQEILNEAPKLISYIQSESLNHFNKICEHLTYLSIPYKINEKLVRGLDYYNWTAFEIKTDILGNQDTICGGGRYDTLIEYLGGPKTPAVGWAIGIERLLMITTKIININKNISKVYIIIQGLKAEQKVWDIIKILEEYKISFNLDLNQSNLKKQMKKASQSSAKICCILGENEINYNYITIKWLKTSKQQKISLDTFKQYLYDIKNLIIT
uniref:Histidine--tRNA ligase, chloroplastic n=1 Tax=Membranoptera weeksiae TaxID=158720 RepID=A0A1N7T4A7_9FLOR|nr:histidine tRNA synthetase [Membranoptera weeksiae]AHZ94633.1 histidine tRNA synthetase [Membranoptera weeksiae]